VIGLLYFKEFTAVESEGPPFLPLSHKVRPAVSSFFYSKMVISYGRLASRALGAGIAASKVYRASRRFKAGYSRAPVSASGGAGQLRRFGKRNGRRRRSGGRTKGGIMTTQKDFTVIRNRGAGRRSKRRYRKLRKFAQIQKSLEIPMCTWNYSTFNDQVGSNGDQQIWSIFPIATTSDLNGVVARAKIQEMRGRLVEGTDVDTGSKSTETDKAYISSVRYELSIQCINSFSSYLIRTPTGPSTGGMNAYTDSTHLSPVIFDVYYCIVRRNIPDEDFTNFGQLFSTDGALPYSYLNTYQYYGGKIHTDAAETAATDLAVTPYDYTSITRFAKILDRKRFTCTPGQAFQIDNTIPLKKVYTKNTTYIGMKGWTSFVLIAAYDACNVPSSTVSGGVTPGSYKSALCVRYSYKPVPTSTVGVRK